MWSNIIFVVATLCVVNASVIKVYDEREEPVVDEAAEDCDWRACDQLCRNMGFPSGVCIRGRCKCDNFKNAEEELQSPAEPEEPVALRSCNPMECDQRCRRLKFPGGVCVNGRCKCDNFRSAQEELQSPAEPEEPVALRSCNPMECDQRCRRLKFPGGVCVNGRCKCDNFRSVQDFSSLIESYSSPRSCNPQECNQRCRRLKFPGGVCVNGRCKCDNFRSANGLLMSALEQPNEDVGITNDEIEQSNLISDEDESFADFASLIESYSSPRSCNPQECNQRCQRLKFPGGVCVNGRCKCDNFRSADAFIALPVAEPDEEIDTTNDEVEESNLILDEDENLEGEEYSSPRSCNPQECDQRCRRLKFPGGVCVNGRCKCDNFRSAEAESDLEESAQPRWGNCDYLDCQRQCFKIGYYGTCVTGRCECMKPYAMSTVLNVEDRAGPQTCDFAKCQQSCNAIGYRARCVGKRCECISRAAANTEFNLEEPAATQTCNFARCQQSCNAIGYRARCVGKRCECISRAAANTEFNLEEPAAPQTCNFARCQQSCNAIGYRARCVGKRCECISRAAANTEFNLEEPAAPQTCDFTRCYQSCSAIGYRARCVGKRCECISRAAANTEFSLEEPVVRQSCNFIQCNQQCNRIGFRGQCLNGRCQCVGRAATNTEFNLEEPAAPQTCNFARCQQSCNAIGYRARCVGKRCECISRAAANTEFSLEEPTSPQSCNFIQCNQQCNRIGFRGQCLNGRCQCVGRAAANSDLEPEQASASSCYREECKRHCSKLGYLGQCLAGRCKCYTKDLKPMYPQKDTETDAAYSGSDIEEYARLRNCKPELCSLICRFLRYKNGTCVNGRCQCNNDEDSQNNTTPKPVQERNEESTSENVLSNEIEDSSQVLNEKVEEMIAEDDTTTNEVEESNQMPNTEEEGEDLHHRLTRNTCYKNACNSLCKATTGFTGYCNNKNKCTCRKYI